MNALKIEPTSVRRQRAEAVRDLEYLRELSGDDYIRNRTIQLDTMVPGFDAKADDRECLNMMKRVTTTCDEDKDVEIDRILNSDKSSVTLDEIIGVDQGTNDIDAELIELIESLDI